LLRIKPELAAPKVKYPKEVMPAKMAMLVAKLIPTTLLYLAMVLSLSSLKNFGALKWDIYAVESILIKMKTLGETTEEAPLLPKDGISEGEDMLDTNFPAGGPRAYVFPKYRMAMAIVVYPMPRDPNKEKGARLERFLSRHSGSNTRLVIPKREVVLDAAMPAVCRRLVHVSARIML